MKEKWTPQEVDILRMMVAQEEYARAIARRLGRNRNQVIGKCRRLRIQLKHAQVPNKPGRPRKRRKRKNKVPIDPTNTRLTREQVVELQEQPGPEPLHIRVENLEPTHCRWPYGNHHPFTFCGHERLKGQPYCRYHTARSQP